MHALKRRDSRGEIRIKKLQGGITTRASLCSTGERGRGAA